MSRYKITEIDGERIHFQDQTGKMHNQPLYDVMDDDAIHFFSREHQGLIIQKGSTQGAYIAKTRTDEKILVSLMRERYLPIFVLFFIASMIVSVLMAPRVIHIGEITVAGGFLFFPLVFACTDIINELYGYQRVKRVIYSSAVCMLAIATLMTISLNLSGTVNGGSDAIFINMYKDVPVILVSCAMSFLIADSLNAYLFHKVKSLLSGKALWLRSMASTFVSQIIFSPLNGTFLYWVGHFDTPITEKLDFYLQNHGIKLAYAFAVLPIIYAAVYYVRYQAELRTWKLKKNIYHFCTPKPCLFFKS